MKNIFFFPSSNTIKASAVVNLEIFETFFIYLYHQLNTFERCLWPGRWAIPDSPSLHSPFFLLPVPASTTNSTTAA